MDFSLSNCLESGIDNIAAVTDYQRLSMADYLTRWSSENERSNRSELSILEPRNGHYLGTADAVYQNIQYLVDNQVETVLVLAAVNTANTILLEAGLSYLGIGVPPPTPTWGGMIADGQPYFVSAPLIVIAPGVAIVLTVLAFNLIGRGLQETLDPHRTR